MIFTLGFFAISLTVAMFVTRERMLAWPAVIFWGIFGGYCYKLFATPWVDITYYLFFAGAVGMTIFCTVAQFALREIDNRKTDEDEYVDEAADPDKTTYYDEQGNGADSPFWDESHDEDGFLKDEFIGRESVVRHRRSKNQGRSGSRTRAR